MTIHTLHGREILDSYRWLEKESNPRTVAWVERQNAQTRAVLDGISQRTAIHARLKQLISIGYVSVPAVRKGRYFYMRREGEQNHAVLYVREGLSGTDRIVLDPNAWSKAGTTALDWSYATRDGRLLAYGVSEAGDEKSTLRVLDVATGQHLADVIPHTRAASVAWLPDAKGFYYTRYPSPGSVAEGEDNYHRRVYFHRLGSDPRHDALIFGEGRDRTDWPSVTLSPDGRWLLISVSVGWTRTDVYLLDLRDGGPPRTVVEGEDNLYSGVVVEDVLYLQSNVDAPRFRLYRTPVDRLERSQWSEILPESPEAVLEDFRIVGRKLVVTLLEKASSRLRLHELDGRLLRDLPLPTLGSVGGVGGEWDGDELFFGFESYTVPPTVLRHDLRDGATSTFMSIETDLNPNRYTVEQVTYPSRDGTLITMFLIHARGGKRPYPTVLTGYGGFNVPMTPGFSRHIYLWLESGGLYAVPNLRGGSEYGEDWHRAGMLEHKQNVFDDFIAASEYLVREGWTTSDRLTISGGSNGGLLVGAVLTQRPELYKAVVCSVPLLDMLRYHHFRIARLWIPEYGDPDNPEHFEWLYRYSPYHRVVDGAPYPAILLMTGESDSRVDPMHARKMAARLKKATSSNQPVLLRVETKAGHGAGKPISKVLDELTDSWSFIFWQLQVTPG